ncbi:hypothetical protein GUITHDRAFT_154955 [Guillardia theta CCMP2712]|uniref:Uncharacterized protein n=1 Tax=Guillardia theta (strain CCMP2712) TaxID=905079 RepID=L1INR4_GUITC|nr:hypothetical protein GUITHDRAFT_154955 [Guillardia theta CCMP2712]EKX37529.1 hypothetical protein GUITHDRAFT_154955 [Guillardia theta CCMP2712]|eukprot:XP_005824509.1 hypothetical protein GUITHDRAFT_154955 [Guillardia theta CCMP2712]
MQEIVNDIRTNGPMAILKYYSDPDAMSIFSKITGLLGLPADFSKASEQFAKMTAGGAAGAPGAEGEAGAPAGQGGANSLE